MAVILLCRVCPAGCSNPLLQILALGILVCAFVVGVWLVSVGRREVWREPRD